MIRWQITIYQELKKAKDNDVDKKKFTKIVYPGSGVAGGIIQSETGAEEFVLLNKEATRAAFFLYIPAQTQTQMYPC